MQYIEKKVLDECKELARRESEVEPIEALRLLTEGYMENCGISKTTRTVIFDAAEYWMERLCNSRHPLAAIAREGTFAHLMPYVNEEYRKNYEHYDEYDICVLFDRSCAFEIAQDILDSHSDEAFRIAFATGFLDIERLYDDMG